MSAQPLTAAELRGIEDRVNAANPGPWRAVMPQNTWHIKDAEGGYILEGSKHTSRGAVRGWQPDAEFIAHAREDVPRLIATVRTLRAVLTSGLYGRWTEEEIDVALATRGKA